MIVASAYPFRAILGIELAAGLVAIAARKAAIVGRAHPERTKLQARLGDAGEVVLPPGRLVVFNFNAFPRAQVRQIIGRLAAVATPDREVFFVYENPVCSDVPDAAPEFSRWFASRVPCAGQERSHSAKDGDPVVVWRAGDPARIAHPGADAAVRETRRGWRAELQLGAGACLASAALAPT